MRRDQFPVADRLIYMNHAAVAPLPRVAAEAMQRFATDALEWGSWHYSEWLDSYEGVRRSMARMVNATPAEIALTKNTSEGIATVAMGIDWRAGDRIVCFEEEFPANVYPWLRLERQGVKITWARATDSLDSLDEKIRGARLVALSFVQFLTGYRADLNAIGKICKDRGAFFFVDAIQGLGVFPLDVRAANIGAFAADGHKWLLGPEGCAVLFVAKEWQDAIEPVEVGWTNFEGFDKYQGRTSVLRPDAGRYENGSLNTIGCYGLRASLDLILDIGVANISAKVQALGDRLAEGAVRKGYEVLGHRTPTTGAGIVSVRKSGIDATELNTQLKQNQVTSAARMGWLRLSPHFYLEPEEIDRVVGYLP